MDMNDVLALMISFFGILIAFIMSDIQKRKRPYRLSARHPVATPVIARPVRRSNVQTAPHRT